MRDEETNPVPAENSWTPVAGGHIFTGDVFDGLSTLQDESFQSIIADPPYFQVLEKEAWDNGWPDESAYLDWCAQWVRGCARLLAEDGLLFIFGQPGKREHAWIRLCARLTEIMAFHDLLVWDRVVGYNERRDSFTPQFEMILVLRHPDAPKVFFDKDAVRIPYDEKTIASYLKDKRYKDKAAREAHLRKGRYATNILRVPSLKGNAREKAGHPSQKPIALIRKLVAAATRPGDAVLDPFLGSGTTAAACEEMGRRWAGIEREKTYTANAVKRLNKILPSLFHSESSELL